MFRTILTTIALLGVGTFGLAEDQKVVVPTDDKPFTVSKNDLIRLKGQGIAGSKIEIAKIEGPVKLDTTRSVIELVNGAGKVGSQIREFELKPTDTGKVKVTIQVTTPMGEVLKKVVEFEIK